jgi:WD40 repeat protein
MKAHRLGHPKAIAAAAADPPAKPAIELPSVQPGRSYDDAPSGTYNVAWSADGDFLAAAGRGSVAVWPEAGDHPTLMPGFENNDDVLGLAWHPSRPQLAIAADGGRVRLWTPGADSPRDFCELPADARGVGWSPDGSRLAVTDGDGGLGVWDAETGALIGTRMVHESQVNRPCWSPSGEVLVTCGIDGTIHVLSSDDLQQLHLLSTGDQRAWDIDLSFDGRYIASGSEDGTVRIWDLASGAQIAGLEGLGDVNCVRFSVDAEFLLSMSNGSISVSRCRDWERVSTVSPDTGTNDGIGGLAVHPAAPILAVKDRKARCISTYRIDYARLRDVSAQPTSRRYVNDKVVLLGDTGVGKSGLGLVLSGQPYQPTDSTHGRNVWTFDAQEVENQAAGQQTREVLLWDLAGQPGYRLVHQLHLGEVAVALVVFDSRSETVLRGQALGAGARAGAAA